jgi:TonB family protein
MKNRNDRLFFALLFAAALIHSGALILIPDVSRRIEEKPPKISPVQITFSFPPETPELPPPPPPAGPSQAEAEEPRPPAPLPEPAAPLAQESPVEPEPAETELAGEAELTPDTSEAEPSPVFTETEPLTPLTEPAAGIPIVFDPETRSDLLLRYRATIRLMIDKQKEYPYQARRQDQEGTVEIRFVLSRQGQLAGEPVLDKRSRYRLLNTAAIEAVKKAVPYPPFPPEFPEEEMSFSVTLAFSLR